MSHETFCEWVTQLVECYLSGEITDAAKWFDLVVIFGDLENHPDRLTLMHNIGMLLIGLPVDPSEWN